MVTRVVRAFGVRLVHPTSGLVLSKDADELAIYEVCERADERGMEVLSFEERVVVQAWAAKGTIDNGGFHYYFEGAWMIRAVEESFRTLGFADVADACRDAAGFFPGGVPPRDWQRRSEILAKISADGLEALDDRVWALKWDDLKESIVQHMERNSEKFGGFQRAAKPGVEPRQPTARG